MSMCLRKLLWTAHALAGPGSADVPSFCRVPLFLPKQHPDGKWRVVSKLPSSFSPTSLTR